MVVQAKAGSVVSRISAAQKADLHDDHGQKSASPAGQLTGKHVFAITVSAFALITAVNLLLAWQAVATFPGLEVANSYVASQDFNARRDAQEALGWTVAGEYHPGLMTVSLTDGAGQPVKVAALKVLIGRTTAARDDVTPAFIWNGAAYQSEIDLGPGKWMMKVEATAQNGTSFERRVDFSVKG